MNARDVIAKMLPTNHNWQWADEIIDRLQENGFTIMSKEDVEPVRDKALEEAAAMCEEPRRFHDGSEITMPSGMAYAAAIRSLKSTP